MRKRIAIIHRDKCHPQECGNYLCAKLCPVNRTGADCITPGADTKARIDEVLCTGCGICPKRCPFGAIEIINLPETVNKDPIHRYGENLFELYSLPTPLFDKVTGIVGRNGLGKSTAFKILSNLLKPNLGNWNEDTKLNELKFREVLDYFKGTQMQTYLEKLHRNEITVSYKPQQVDLIPKQFSGTVRQLLEKLDMEGKMSQISEELQLAHFLETDISKISGGELQRVAIAAATLKKANLYLLDEPTSYLDIKQRINISHFISTLATPETAPMVIEHDLIILDYMTDLVNIMYGNEGAFGVVSGVKPTREGINAYLEGYLKSENVRFRDRAIKFENSQQNLLYNPQDLVQWDKLRMTLGTFHFNAEPGSLYKGEIIGVLGENGIGKTSFVKMLAGLIKPEGEIIGDVVVSYKPQYLETYSDTTVAEFLHDTITNYFNQIIKPLDIEKLFTSKLSELSGGQLQRVSIAYCLGKDANLFLLDEPSAYLDVEQRLLISKIVKNVAQEREVTILVVDHDLMFIDYIADRLLVFTGKPAQMGKLGGPYTMEEGMNIFLKELDVTLRRDVTSHRPRINKTGSVKDREQRAKNAWYYN